MARACVVCCVMCGWIPTNDSIDTRSSEEAVNKRCAAREREEASDRARLRARESDKDPERLNEREKEKESEREGTSDERRETGESLLGYSILLLL